MPYLRPAAAIALAVTTLIGAGASAAERVEVQSDLLRLDEAQRQKAVSDLLTPSTVKLPGGKMKLSEALAALAASGNPTTADASVDLAREADVAASAGTYWEALSAICAAFNLEPKPGVPAGGQSSRGDRPVAVQTGALELKDAGPKAPLLIPDGPILAEVTECELKRSVGARRESSAQLAIALRVEPKLASERIGETSLRLARVGDQSGHALNVDNDGAVDPSDLPEQFRLHLRLVEEPSALLIDGDLKIGLVEPWHVSVPLKPGESSSIACGGNTLDLRLVDANHQGLSGGQGPLLELFFPRDALAGDPRIRLANAGKSLAPRGNGASQTASGRVVYATFAALEDLPYDALVNGAARLGAPQRLDLRVPIDLARLSAKAPEAPKEVDAFSATRLSWPAGKATLKQAVARLEIAGNQVLLQLGTDEQASRDLPTFSGTFWEGVLALCAAYDLDILPPTAPPVGTAGEGNDAAACLAGGPLGLGPKRAGGPTHQACGALLIEIGNVTATTSRGLGGGGRQAEAVCHFRLEPRVDAEVVGACSVAANSYASDEKGRPVSVSDSQPSSGNGGSSIEIERGQVRFNVRAGIGRVRIRSSGDDDQSPPRYDLVFTANGLAADAASLAVTGQVRIEVQRQVRAEATLAPGVPTSIPYGEGTLTATLYDPNAAVAAGLRQPALGLSGQGNLMETSMQLIPPSGMPLTANGHGSWTRNGRQEMLYLYPIAEEGPYKLVINDTVHVADVRVPFSATVPLPAP